MTRPTAGNGRADFVARLDELFAAAGVEHVVLHSGDDAAQRDSDVDVAVAREDIRLVDPRLALASSARCSSASTTAYRGAGTTCRDG